MSGRTLWWPKDAAWWRRDRVTELGETHGPGGPAVLDYLTCEARAQGPIKNHDGTVKAGYVAIKRACFLATLDDAKAIIATAVDIGALDDLEDDGRMFTCRISGWTEDVDRPLAASRKAAGRQGTTGDNGGQTGTTGAEVAQCPPKSSEVTREVQEQDRELHPLTPTSGGTGKRRGSRADGTSPRQLAAVKPKPWFEWAEQHMPSVPVAFVAQAATMVEKNHHEVTVEAVTARLQATYPHVFGEAA